MVTRYLGIVNVEKQGSRASLHTHTICRTKNGEKIPSILASCQRIDKKSYCLALTGFMEVLGQWSSGPRLAGEAPQDGDHNCQQDDLVQ